MNTMRSTGSQSRLLLLSLSLWVHCQAFQAPNPGKSPGSFHAVSTLQEEEGHLTSTESSSFNTTDTYPPVALPFSAGLGFLWYSAQGRAHKYQVRLRQKYGNAYIIWDKYVVLSDPDAIQDVLEKCNLPKDPDVLRGYKVLFGSDGGILSAPWKEWQIQRRRMSPPFSAPGVRNIQISGKIEECTHPFLKVVDQVAGTDQSLEMDSLFLDVTMDIIGSIVLNRSFHMCDRHHATASKPTCFRDAVLTLMEESIRQMTLPPDTLRLRPKFLLRKLDKARLTIDDFLQDCIQTREQEGDTSDYSDLLQILLKAEKDGEITREQLKTQLFTILFAGHESTAHSLSYMLWEVSQNSTLQELLAEEAKRVLPNPQDDMATIDYNSNSTALVELLPWLDRSFSETLRKHPVTSTGVARVVDQDTPIVVGNGLEIPPRTSVFIPPWSLHRNEEIWSNPQQFDPSRFIDTSAIHPHAFQGFSAGPRNCLGSRLARMEALHIMAPLLRRYVVTCKETTEPDDFVTIVRRPRHGIQFHFQKRGKS